MKGNGVKIGFTIAFLAIAIYYLQFSVRYWLLERHLNSLSGQTKTEYSTQNQKEIDYLRERVLNLGLDLQGGMHVTLQLDTPRLLIDLAREGGKDTSLTHTIERADAIARKNNTDFIDEFVKLFEAKDPNARLSRYYRSEADNITRRSTNEQIAAYLKKQRDSAVNRAIQIIRTRIDRFGVNEPNIVKQGHNRIAVELPGVQDEQRVRHLLKGTARLEFRLCADPAELQSSLKQIVTYFNKQDTTSSAKNDSTAAQNNPLLKVFMPEGQSVIFGSATAQDSAKVDSLLSLPAVKALLPRNVELMWYSKSSFSNNNGTKYYNLIGVRDQVELTGDVIEEARPEFDRYTNAPEVSMTMDRDGARKWARLTGANINKPIAIVLDGLVYTYPRVITKINDGRSSITGLASTQEAEDLVNILMSGALPAPLQIVEQRTVGPSLGEASIHSGFNSTVMGLIIVAVFMILYYHKGGSIADLALLFNILFILGIMAAFKATLTLPGIAGIVLTIGMAVDANVLIFERIREELNAGKSMRAAIDSGYANAMSAIIDSNITTFLTGAILYSFGSGPIKGFAVTLMAGIASSLFTAIIITRIVVDYLTRDKVSAVSFG